MICSKNYKLREWMTEIILGKKKQCKENTDIRRPKSLIFFIWTLFMFLTISDRPKNKNH
jgi:hypothetical protein